MHRPGPLQEFPLEQFLPSNPNLPSASKSRPNKRPLSPGSPNLFSPVKRRILNEEGIFSPEKIFKSPISARGTPARFIADVLNGPSSPARKLDFGVPKPSAQGACTPPVATVNGTPTQSASTSNRLAPSPELKSNSWPSRSGDSRVDACLGVPSCSSSSRSSAVPTSVPREMPPPPDPQSVHYPGFHVHCDTHVLIISVDNDLETLSLTDNDKEGQKENLAPRRKPRKVVTAPNTDLKSQFFSPDAKKREIEKLGRAKSTPVTPKRHLGRDEQGSGGSPTPRRSGMRLIQAMTSSTPRAMEMERREMRRALQDEVDNANEEESDKTGLRN